MRQEIMERVTTVINKATEYRNSFDTYAYLWVDDRTEFMRQFLLYNHVLTAEEIEAHVEDGVPECPPTLEQFKEQVMYSIIVFIFSPPPTGFCPRGLHTETPSCSKFAAAFCCLENHPVDNRMRSHRLLRLYDTSLLQVVNRLFIHKLDASLKISICIKSEFHRALMQDE